MKENKDYSEERVNAFVCDITKDRVADNVPESSVQIDVAKNLQWTLEPALQRRLNPMDSKL